MVTLKELEQAHEQWIIAQQEFNQAEPEFVEDATHRLTAAELKYNTLIRLAKQKGVLVDEKKDMLRERYFRSASRGYSKGGWQWRKE